MLNPPNDRSAKYSIMQISLLILIAFSGYAFLASGLDPTGGTWSSYGGELMPGYNPNFASTSQSSDMLYVVGTDGSLWLNKLPKWYYLGGQITSSPAVCKDAASWHHVFVRGTDGCLWDRRVDLNNITETDAPGDWIYLGGYIKGKTSPATIYLPFRNSTITLIQGGDDGLWGKEMQTTAASHPQYTEIVPIQGPWVNLGGKIIGSPDVDSRFDMFPEIHFDIFAAVRGADNALWINQWDPSGLNSSWHYLGGILASDPSMIPNIQPHAQGAELIYAKGSDGALWVNGGHLDTMDFGWGYLGGQISGSDSPALSFNSADQTNHAAVKGTDNGLWDCELSNSTWHGNWYNLGGQIASKPDMVFGPDLELCVRGMDGALWRYYKSIS